MHVEVVDQKSCHVMSGASACSLFSTQAQVCCTNAVSLPACACRVVHYCMPVQ